MKADLQTDKKVDFSPIELEKEVALDQEMVAPEFVQVEREETIVEPMQETSGKNRNGMLWIVGAAVAALLLFGE